MDGGLDAGPFGPWLARTMAVLRERAEADVPCDGCTACCASSQFVLVEPDEHEVRAHVPAELLFPAPGAPDGFSVLPYDEHGRCPMLGAEGCSIYDHRPRTCRAYDCRVLAAAEVDVHVDTPAVARRVDRWRFGIDGDDDRRDLVAVRAASRFLEHHAAELPGGGPPPTQRAALAVELHELFRGGEPTVDDVVAAIAARRPRR